MKRNRKVREAELTYLRDKLGHIPADAKRSARNRPSTFRCVWVLISTPELGARTPGCGRGSCPGCGNSRSAATMLATSLGPSRGMKPSPTRPLRTAGSKSRVGSLAVRSAPKLARPAYGPRSTALELSSSRSLRRRSSAHPNSVPLQSEPECRRVGRHEPAHSRGAHDEHFTTRKGA